MPDAAVLARLQACLDTAERPAVGLDRDANIVASNRAATNPGGSTSAATFSDLIAACACDLAGPCSDVDAALYALELDLPSRARSVDGRERVRLVPFAEGLVVAISRYAAYMAELDPLIVRSEIHDGLSQDLSALGFAACALRLRLADLDDPILAELSARVESLAETASTTVRALYRHFERGAIGGLIDALATMAAELEEATGTELWIRVDGVLSGPAPSVRDAVVAMTRAAVVALHPRTRAWLRLSPDGDTTRIEIHTSDPIDRLDDDARTHLDDHADATGATWIHVGARIEILC